MEQINVKTLDSTLPWVYGYGCSHIGGRSENQDSLGSAMTRFGFLTVVCDGMGGGPAGALASSMAVDRIIEVVSGASPEEGRLDIVVKAVRSANDVLVEHIKENPELMGMGSTCTVLLIDDDSAIAAYVGDSRIYQLHGTRKKWRTFDHSLVFSLVKKGAINEEEARRSPQSNIITRALGIQPEVKVDAFELPFSKGDRFVLTTDGVHGSMPEPELLKLLGSHDQELELKAKAISATVEQIGVKNGGEHDNHTLAMIDIDKSSKLSGKMNKTAKILISVLLILLLASAAVNVVLYMRLQQGGTGAATEQTQQPAADQQPVTNNP